MTDQMTSAKQILETKLRSITQPRGWRDSIAIEQTADPIDTTQRALELEMATRGLDRDANLSRQIRAAIERVDSGEYGVCLECGEPISEKRLTAVPWAVLCIRCQRRADENHRSADEWLEGRFADAA